MKKPTRMDQLSGIGKALGKYKYAVLVLLLGAGLMLFPADKGDQPEQGPKEEQTVTLELQLEGLLSRIQGAGDVDVLLTLEESEVYTYQTDEHTRTEETEQETVILSDGAGQRPVIAATRSPVYRGAVVVCHGADDPSVKLSIVKAVQDLTGLGSDKISVIKMKEQ